MKLEKEIKIGSLLHKLDDTSGVIIKFSAYYEWYEVYVLMSDSQRIENFYLSLKTISERLL